LTTALGEQSCGCLLIEKAQKEVDPNAKLALEMAGKEAQKSWGCHIGGFEPLTELSPAQKESLNAVSNLIKSDCNDCKTCPRADLYFYNSKGEKNIIAEDIQRVVKLRTWRDKGQLHLVTGDTPSNTMVEAIDCLDEAYNIKEAYDLRQQREKWENERKKSEESNPTIKSKVRF
jgi:hypothetical protein